MLIYYTRLALGEGEAYCYCMLKKYLEYFRNNPEHYWFKRKIWGWGWVPATREGWLVTFLYGELTILVVSVVNETPIDGNPDSGTNLLVRGLPLMLLTLGFIYIVYKKGEKPKWQWGLTDSEKENDHD